MFDLLAKLLQIGDLVLLAGHAVFAVADLDNAQWDNGRRDRNQVCSTVSKRKQVKRIPHGTDTQEI